jgi:hypothetical protein
MKQYRNRWLLTVASLCAVVVAPVIGGLPAEAGAPNYECLMRGVGSGRPVELRVGIDQHRKYVMTRTPRSTIVLTKITREQQNGPSLGMTAGELNLEIRKMGRTVTGTFGDVAVSGSCVVIRGDYVLAATSGDVDVFRSPGGSPSMSIRPGSLIWTGGRFSPVGSGTQPLAAGWSSVLVAFDVQPGSQPVFGLIRESDTVKEVCALTTRQAGWDPQCSDDVSG